MAGFEIKASPDEMEKKAAEVEKEIAEIEKMWEKIKNIVQSSKNYWEGEASEAHQNIYRALEQDGDRVIKRLKEHPEELCNMAGWYSRAEQNAQGKSKNLIANII